MTLKDQSTIHLTKKLFLLIERRRRYQFLILLTLMILTSMFEVISIGAVIPFLGVLIEPSNIFELPAAQPFIQFLGVDQPTQIIFPISALFASAVVMAGAMRVLLLWASVKFSFILGVDLSVGIFTQVINQPYIAHTKQNSSDIISAISIKIAQVINGVVLSVLNIISSFIIVTAIITILIIINPSASLIAILFFSALYVFFYLYVKQKLKVNSLNISRESNSLIKISQEALGGIRDIIINGNQQFYRSIFWRADLVFRKSLGNTLFLTNSPRYFMETFGILLIVLLAYMLSTQGEKSFAEGIPVLGALALGAQRLLPVMQVLYNSWGNIKGTHFVLEEVLGFLNLNDTKTMNVINDDCTFEKNIRLKDVSFGYDENSLPAINNINIDIKKGETSAIVGSTGSGKSTLIKLLLRLYDSTSGEIIFDNDDIKDLEIDSLRNKIGLVSQDIFLFEGTVFENIAYGNLNASDEEVWEAARLSESDKFINLLPNKEKTIVGERGQKLSGGQRQRISIARAILKNPEILILDEATSAVDNETEAAIQRSINTLKKGRTVIAIAHRLSTIRNAEIIYVLEEGRIVESGNHESLLDIKGVYSKLWSVQTGEKIS